MSGHRKSSALGGIGAVVDSILGEPARKLSAVDVHPTAQSVSSFSMALLAFSCVAGGPFGIEVAVQSAGAFATILGLIAAGSLWGLPTALITAELAAAIPANGGPVVWVRRGLGKQWAFVNAILLVLQQATDIVLYPTLLASYIQQLFPAMTNLEIYGVKMLSLVITTALNVVGVEALSASAAVLTGIIMLPFVMLPIVAEVKKLPFDWSQVGPAGIPKDYQANLALFSSTVLWNMQGWSELGALAGEVQNAEIVFPRGMMMAAVLVVLAYASPVLFGVALQPDLTKWQDGFLADLAQDVAPWLSGFVLVSASLANLSTFITSMAAYSRTLQAVAREGFIPIPYLARNMGKWHTPLPCIAILAIATAALMYGLDFSQLVVMDSTFFMIAQISAILSWIRLRYKEPHLPRPYLFPGGPAVAHLVAVLTCCIAAFAIYAVCSGDDWWAAAASAGVVLVLLGVSFFMKRLGLGIKVRGPGIDHEEELEGEGEEGEGVGGRGGSGSSTTADTERTALLKAPDRRSMAMALDPGVAVARTDLLSSASISASAGSDPVSDHTGLALPSTAQQPMFSPNTQKGITAARSVALQDASASSGGGGTRAGRTSSGVGGRLPLLTSGKHSGSGNALNSLVGGGRA